MDPDTEFVFENLSLESLQILPGHAKISHTTSVDIDAPAAGDAARNMCYRTRIQFTGVQLTLKEVSFYYHDKGTKPIKSITGLLDDTIPEKGIDLDVTLAMLPSATGAAERRRRHAFHKIENVTAHLTDVKVAICESNHQASDMAISCIFFVN